MSGKFCMNGTFTTGNRKVGNVTWQFNPLALLKRDEEVREKVPLENEEGLGFCKKDDYLSRLLLIPQSGS